MSTQSLLSYWKESLEIFSTKGELKPYALGTLVMFKRALTIIVKKFWWLLLMYLSIPYFFLSDSSFIHRISLRSHKLLLLAVLYLIIMSIRPSLERKDSAYFTKYLSYIWSIYLLIILPDFFMLPILAPLIGLVCLFFFDSRNSLRYFGLSIMRTLKVIVYFLPALLILFFSIWGVAIALGLTLVPIVTCLDLLFGIDHYLSVLISFSINSLIHFLILLMSYSTVSVLYTKLKHKHYNLLFGLTP